MNNPNATYQELPDKLTFIRRPPPSAPSPESYVTAPSSPLVSGDIRQQDAAAGMPPIIFGRKKDAERMSDENIARMRKLRQEDPQNWTAGKLAKEFGCSQYFVRYVATLNRAERRASWKRREELHEKFRARWGEKTVLEEEIRKKRREFW